MAEIKVSVIIPAHNAAQFLAATIASAQQQTLAAIEIIVVDDGSTDDTAAIIKALAAEDARVKLEAVYPNQGVANARNVGVRAAHGEYVAFLDADDLWLPDKLQQQVAYLEAHHAQFGYGNYELMDTHGQRIGERRINEASLNHTQMLRGNRIGMLTAIVRRDLAVAHPFPAMHSEDYACWLAIAKTGVVAVRCGEQIVARYRKHASSTSANKLQAAQWTWRIYRDYEKMNLIAASVAFVRYAYMAVFDRR